MLAQPPIVAVTISISGCNHTGNTIVTDTHELRNLDFFSH